MSKAFKSFTCIRRFYFRGVLFPLTSSQLGRLEKFKSLINGLKVKAKCKRKKAIAGFLHGQGKVREFCKRSGNNLEVCKSQ